jgi:hypothetical protein
MALALALATVVTGATAPASAGLVRSAIKIDVRDQAGRPREATVRVRGPSGEVPVTRAGEVYVADGLVEGEYAIEVAGAGTQTVAVRGRIERGAVFVVGARAAAFVLGPSDRVCDGNDGVVVEAVAFARGGGLGAGRLDVRGHGKPVCSAIVAGGAATLKLPPGDYDVTARLVGGGVARARYHVPHERAPLPLTLRAR